MSSSTDTSDDCKHNIDGIIEDLGKVIISEEKINVSTEQHKQPCDNNEDRDSKPKVDTKADNDDSVECSLCGWGQTKKICISCEQKMEKAMNNDTSRNNNTDTCSIEQDIYDHIVRVSTTLDKCAACGKEGDSDEMNTCNKCKYVKYCNAACKKKHRKKHKKACERRVAELHDEKLFADPPKTEECPICMMPLPLDINHIQFQNCCGKRICVGCIYGMVLSNAQSDAKNMEDKICPYCRTPGSTTEEEDAKRTKKLIENGNYRAISTFATSYAEGEGVPQDMQKARELWLQAGKLGSADGYHNLGTSYFFWKGVRSG